MNRKKIRSQLSNHENLCQPSPEKGDPVEVHQDKANFRGFIENLSVMFYAAEPNPPYATIYVSPAFKQLGYALEDWTKTKDFWMRALHPEDRDWVLKKTGDAMRDGAGTDYEYRMVTRDGTIYWVRDRGSFTRDAQGNLVCWQGIIVDITERKQAEESLRESEIRFRTIFENANDLIYVHDSEGNYLSINKATEKILGYKLEEALQLNMQQVVVPEHFEFAQRKLAEKIAGNTEQAVYEIDCITKSGERVTLEINSSPIYREGRVVAVQGIARDITEHNQAQKSLKASEAALRDLFHNAPNGYHELDREGRIVRINQTELNMLGYTAEEMIGRFLWDFVVEKDTRSKILEKISGASPPLPTERTFRCKNGMFLSALLKSVLIRDENGEVRGIRANIQDITEQKRAEKALKDSERRYRQLGEGIMHQVWTAKPDGKLDYINRRALAYFGRANIRKSGGRWQYFVHPEDLEQCENLWKHSLETGEDYLTQYRLRRRDGEYFWFQGRGTAGRDAEGKIASWFGTNSDIENQKKIEAQIHHIAEHDTLTNLPNRAKFMHHLERAVTRTEHNPAFKFAVLFLDLDRFKIINDSLGHGTGDKLLVALSERIAECLRPNDVVARLGGDEFTVLLRGIDKPAAAARVAERILKKLSVPFQLDAYEVFTSASIGIIVSDDLKRQPEDFLRDADAAMYRAKAAGKARYEIFDREMHIQNMNMLQLENDLRWAVERNEFRAFYQPIVALETGEIVEFEALLRWQHPQRGLISPNDFIGIAEETGLIVSIGRWILEEACRQTAVWQSKFSKHRHLSVSVNLSAKQLLHPDVLAQVKDVLKRTAFDSQRLKLEVTESMVMENGEKSLAVINEFRALGVAVSTDDFGTGYSSLSYLHRFPFDRLKIDRSFVGKMEKDSKSEAIVRTILMLGQNLEIETIAEGVENEEQLKQLRALGCRFGQGYFFSKPVDANSAEKLLEKGLAINLPPEKLFDYGELDEKKILKLENVQ